MDSTEKFLSSQLIAYIGNKRRLRGFLREVFSELEDRMVPDRTNSDRIIRFGDVFAGSGSVSRLAKSMGFSVGTNDWELYSWLLNKTHIELSPDLLGELFADEGGIEGRLDFLNNLYESDEVTSGPGSAYISRYYAPAVTRSADYRYERLFYTRENAVFIDNVRNTIESWYPGWELSETEQLKKTALLTPLLYQAATHANTSGVFKAYHKGFGGHGSDALTRIMAKMQLQKPVLIENLPQREYGVERQDAEAFASGRSFDICYLDPPYNQHQYGSNYFMLNTIALWDRPEVSTARRPDGGLTVKAGIRADWKSTRSEFCYRKSAPEALCNLIESIDSRYIVLSYNTEGIIPFDELHEILSSYGRIEIFCKDYVIYRGGKQSMGRANRNVEFQLVLSRNEKSESSDRGRIDRILLARSIVSLMNESFCPDRIKERFRCDGMSILIGKTGQRAALRMDGLYQFSEIPSLLYFNSFSPGELNEVSSNLEYCRCIDKKEEVRVIKKLILDFKPTEQAPSFYRKYWTELLRALRKFAFKKYRDDFNSMLEEIDVLLSEEIRKGRSNSFSSIEAKFTELKRVAVLRINN
ncbi:MAG: DNA adenine methylase [Spirochaetales bacterium]|nr:DNA adenine methylase [Spirochaetales bacterium]